MKKMYRYTLFGFLLFFAAQTVSAQDNTQTLPAGRQSINLETVLQLGGANNLTIKKYKQKQKLALADLDKAREWWLPDIYTGATAHQLWGAAMNTDGVIFTDLNRQNFWGGIGINASWDFGKRIFNAKAENLQAQASVYLTIAERNNALLEIIETYYDFLLAQLYYKAYEQLVVHGDTITQQISVQVEAGMRYESELLLSQSNQNHLKVEMLKAKMKYSTKSAALVKLLNLPPNVKLVSTDSLLAPLELVEQLEDVILNDSIYNNRPEFKATNLMLQSLQVEKRTTTTGLWLPDLQLGTYTSMFGDVISPLYPTSAINASLRWKIPLGRLTYGGELAQFNAKIAIQKTEIEEVKAIVNEEVLNARETMYIAQEQMEIALEGSEQAEKALMQGMERQRSGTIIPYEILQTQEVYIKSRLDYLNAVSTYNKAQYQLFVAVGNDL